MRMEGKVAFISGSARGIGAAISRLLAREGASVVMGDILEAEGIATERQILETGGQETQRAETLTAGRGTGLPRHGDATGVPDGDALDAARAVHQHADPPVERAADRRHLARQFVSQDRTRRDAAAVQALEPVFFGGRQPQQVTVKRRNRPYLPSPMYAERGRISTDDR